MRFARQKRVIAEVGMVRTATATAAAAAAAVGLLCVGVFAVTLSLSLSLSSSLLLHTVCTRGSSLCVYPRFSLFLTVARAYYPCFEGVTRDIERERERERERVPVFLHVVRKQCWLDRESVVSVYSFTIDLFSPRLYTLFVLLLFRVNCTLCTTV